MTGCAIVQRPVASAAKSYGPRGACIAAPDDVHVRPQQQEIVPIESAGAHQEDRGCSGARRERRRHARVRSGRPASRRAAAACSHDRSRCGPAPPFHRRSHTCGSRAPGQVVGNVVHEIMLAALPPARRRSAASRHSDSRARRRSSSVALRCSASATRASASRTAAPAGCAHGFPGDRACARSGARAPRTPTPRRCARPPAGARSHRRRAGRHAPALERRRSFHDRSMASPTPVFMPTRRSGSRGARRRPPGTPGPRHSVGQQQVHFPLPDIEHVVLDRHGDRPARTCRPCPRPSQRPNAR